MICTPNAPIEDVTPSRTPIVTIGGTAGEPLVGKDSTGKKYFRTEGPQSIDPVVFFKLMLIGYLENLNNN